MLIEDIFSVTYLSSGLTIFGLFIVICVQKEVEYVLFLRLTESKTHVVCSWWTVGVLMLWTGSTVIYRPLVSAAEGACLQPPVYL